MSKYKFNIERIKDAWTELEPLYRRHWNETEGYQQNELDVDFEQYELFEEQGRSVLFTVRTPNDVLCGYLFYTLGNNLHAKGTFVAEEKAIYLHPEVRGGTLAVRLLKYSEETLQELGVVMIHAMSKAPTGGPDIDRLMKHRGFDPVAIYYSKRI